MNSLLAHVRNEYLGAHAVAVRHVDQELLGELADFVVATDTVFTGVGKSWHLAQRVAATGRSLGLRTRAVHATEARHGDMHELLNAGLVVVVSHSGRTQECIQVVVDVRGRVKTVAVTSSTESLLASLTEHVLTYGPVQDRWAVPIGSLAAASMVLDALVLTAGTTTTLPTTHPGGALGGEV